jgi:hypothetical protein
MGYDSNFKLFKALAFDVVFILILWTAGQQISKMDIYCQTGVESNITAINASETFENVTLDFPNSYIEADGKKMPV